MGDSSERLADHLLGRRLSRRDVLRRGLALGLSAPLIGSLLAACGGDDDDDDGGGGAATTGTGAGATPTTGGGSGTGASPTTGGGTSDATATMGGGTTGGGGTLVIGRNFDDLLAFDPAVAYEFSSFPVFWATYQCMLLPNLDNPGTFDPILCEETPSAENGGISEDGMTFTFKIKQGIKFSTGGELQAKDFVFAAKRLAYMKKNPSFLAEPFTEYDADGNPTAVNVEASDDYTVVYTLKAPNAAFLAYMASVPGIPYDSEFIKQNGGLDTPEAETEDKATAWFEQNSAGVGPYQLVSWSKTEEVVLEPFADSHAGPANFDQIVYRFIADSASQLQQLQGGEIHFADDLDPDAINQARDDNNLQVVEQPGLVIIYLALHSEGKPEVAGILADVRVRQAIAHSIDYDGIVEELRQGAAVRPASMIADGMLGADKLEDKKYVEDIDRAKELLTEAGQEDAEFTLSYRANPDDEIYVTKLKADIERSGLKVTLAPGDPANVLQDYRDAKLQSVFLQWGPDYPDVHTNAYPFGGVKDIAPAKRMSYVNEESTALLEQAIQELDPAKREAHYVQVGENMIEDAVFIPIYQPVSQEAALSTITGVTLHPQWFYLLDRFAPA